MTSESEDMDKELRERAKKLTEEIQNMTNYKNLYREIQVEIIIFCLIENNKLLLMCNCIDNYQRLVASPAVKKEDFKNTLIEALKGEGLETEIKNTVFHWKRTQKIGEHVKINAYGVDLNYLKKAQIQWERRIQKSLNSMCNELNVPLARIRSTTEKEELSEKWNELSTCDVG